MKIVYMYRLHCLNSIVVCKNQYSGTEWPYDTSTVTCPTGINSQYLVQAYFLKHQKVAIPGIRQDFFAMVSRRLINSSHHNSFGEGDVRFT